MTLAISSHWVFTQFTNSSTIMTLAISSHWVFTQFTNSTTIMTTTTARADEEKGVRSWQWISPQFTSGPATLCVRLLHGSGA
jgi:hypothetical protein